MELTAYEWWLIIKAIGFLVIFAIAAFIYGRVTGRVLGEEPFDTAEGGTRSERAP